MTLGLNLLAQVTLEFYVAHGSPGWALLGFFCVLWV